MWKHRFLIPALIGLAASGSVLTGCTQTSTPTTPSTQTVGSLRVTLATDPPPHTGDNMMMVTLIDAQTNTPVGNANITATPNMLAPVLAGTATSGRAQGNGVYQIPVRLGIATRYNLQLHILRPDHAPNEADFVIEAAH